MKFLVFAAAMLISTFSFASTQAQYSLDSEVSAVSFATIKLQYVVESAVIDRLSGNIDHAGKASVTIPIANIQTGIGIRNQRLNTLFFDSEAYPNAAVSVQLPESIFAEEFVTKQLDLGALVSLFGTEKTLSFKVNVIKTEDVLVVSTVQPTIVSGNTFGIPSDNLVALAKTVGGIAISDTVPVSFSLVFTPK